MKKFMVVALAALLLPMASLSAEVGGSYSVLGTNPNGSTYEGTVEITNNGGGSYTFNWSIGSSETYSGVGTLSGNTLTVDWGQADPVVYKVLSNGATLKGKWGPKGSGSETLTR